MTPLSKDLLIDAARQRRKLQTVRKTLAVGFGTVPLVALFLLSQAKEESRPEIPSPMVQSPSATPKNFPYQEIESEEELLAILAEQAPAIVTNQDGSRSLILTNPH